MPPAAGQPAALQSTEPGQGQFRGKSVCLSVGVCEGGGVRAPPRERVSRAVAEGRRAEFVCEAESELESVTGGWVLRGNPVGLSRRPLGEGGRSRLTQTQIPLRV